MATLNTLLNNLLKLNRSQTIRNESESRNLLVSKLWDNYSVLNVLKCVIELYQKNKSIDSLKVLNDIILCSPKSWCEVLCNGEKSEHKEKIQIIFGDLFKIARVPLFPHREHHAFEQSDFLDIPQKSNVVFQITNMIIEKLSDNNSSDSNNHTHFIKLILPDLLILIIENLDPNLWTSDQSCTSANKLINKVFSCFAIMDINQLLQIDLKLRDQTEVANPRSTALGKILHVVSPNLIRDKWKYFPGLKVVFFFCLSHTTFPNLSDHLEMFLPPSLLFVDDYMNENKILGIKCLIHITNNVSAEELRWYGRADVILEALKHQLYIHEVPVVEVCHPAILAILKVVEKSPEKILPNKTRSVSRYDDMFEIILQDAECEVNIALRRAYTSHLHEFVDKMGITVVRHSKRLIRLITNYLEVNDQPKETSRLNVLKILERFIKVAWPRMESHIGILVKSLLRFVYDIATDDTATPQATKDELITNAKSCLVLLKCCSNVNFEDILPSVRDANLPEIFKQTINEVLLAEKNQ